MADSVLCTGDSAGLFWNLGGAGGPALPVYLTAEVYFDAADLPTWYANNPSGMSLADIATNGIRNSQDAYLHDGGSAFDGWQDDISADQDNFVISGHLGTGWHTITLSIGHTGSAWGISVDGTSHTQTLTLSFGSIARNASFGASDGGLGATSIYLAHLQLGTTPGGGDLLDYLPCRDGDPVTFGFSLLGATATLATAPMPPPSIGLCGSPGPSPSSIGIRVAFGFDAYDTAATFIRIDEPTVPPLTIGVAANNVIAWQIDRGRSYELDKTQTGTAQLTLLDTSGIFDPTNPASPLWGKIVPMLQAKIGVQNPFTGAYTDLFSGFLESWDWTITTEENLVTIQVGLVDGFEPLTRAEIPVEYAGSGFTPATGTGTIILAATANVQTRLDALLGVAGWPTDPGDKSWRDINTGNVQLQETIYNAQQSVLAAMQDAADAEFPGVANIFMSKRGAVAFRGRYPRFNPSLYPQDVALWTVSDRGGRSEVPTAALIKNIEWTLDQKNVINACLCYPTNIPQGEIVNQLSTNPASITQYGVRTLSLPDLIVDLQPGYAGPPPPPDSPMLTGNQVCFAYAQYYTENYGQPLIRIAKLVFETAGADIYTWNFILGVEIGDIITVITTTPGGGFGKGTGSPESPTPAQFFVEGIHYTASIQNDLYVITLSLDVSPRGWFTVEPWAN